MFGIVGDEIAKLHKEIERLRAELAEAKEIIGKNEIRWASELNERVYKLGEVLNRENELVKELAALKAQSEPVATFTLQQYDTNPWDKHWVGTIPANYGPLRYDKFKVGDQVKLYTRPQPTDAETLRDAERYRWLRRKDTGPCQIWQLVSDDATPLYMDLKTEEELDAAIDAAMKGGA